MSRKLDRLMQMIAPPPGLAAIDFSAPVGAAALFAPDSLTWRVMKNPVSLMIGGIAAVILELAEPRVRTGVWEHTSFRRDPVMRMRRTGYAAMATIYAPAEAARAMIAGVARAHGRVEGVTPAGAPYSANDEELLNWVQATASFGFFEAYSRFVRPLSAAELDQLYAEGAPAAALYGAHGAPRSSAEMETLLATMLPKLERSDIVFEFLDIVRTAPLLPSKWVQRLVVRAAVALTPPYVRDVLGLRGEFSSIDSRVVNALGALAERITLDAPPAQACMRMGLSANHLYR